MYLLISALLLFSAGLCSSQQKLTCSYTPEQKTLPRVWCKRDANNHSCCTGISFKAGVGEPDSSLSVQDMDKAFVVTVNSLSQGDGVYWCGVKNGNNVIIKLAEKKLYSSPPGFIWDVLRWIVFVLLLVAVISTSIYSKRQAAKPKKKDAYNTVMEEKLR